MRGLISDDITPLVENLLEHVRQSENMSKEQMDRLLDEGGEQIFDILENKVTDFLTDKYKVEEFRNQYNIINRNSGRIVDLHEDFFHYFLGYIHTAHIVYNRFLDKLQATDKAVENLELKDQLHLSFYGNLCRQADQIAIELLNGYPDAALRLWRTFYEHTVVAVFLMKQNSNELAERFRDATHKENKKSVESFTKRHVTLKFPPLDEELINRVKKDFDSTKAQYDKDFFDNDYSWAKPYLNGKANFLAIEEAAEMDRYRPFYIWASSKAHPTYKGIMDFRDSSNNIVLKHITIPETDRQSMVDPAQLTLASFHQVNNFFLHLYAGHEYTINQLFFRKIYDRFGDSITSEKVKSN